MSDEQPYTAGEFRIRGRNCENLLCERMTHGLGRGSLEREMKRNYATADLLVELVEACKLAEMVIHESKASNIKIVQDAIAAVLAKVETAP